jgi:hypothetical protein
MDTPVERLRSRDAYRDAAWDWSILDGCFGHTRIAPCDLDGLIERNGRFLVIEAKPGTKPLDRGQEITLNALARTGLFTVLVVWGPRNTPRRLVVLTKDRAMTYDPATLDTLRGIVTRWFTWADRQVAR